LLSLSVVILFDEGFLINLDLRVEIRFVVIPALALLQPRHGHLLNLHTFDLTLGYLEIDSSVLVSALLNNAQHFEVSSFYSFQLR
jgi:hypothetical protein